MRFFVCVKELWGVQGLYLDHWCYLDSYSAREAQLSSLMPLPPPSSLTSLLQGRKPSCH